MTCNLGTNGQGHTASQCYAVRNGKSVATETSIKFTQKEFINYVSNGGARASTLLTKATEPWKTTPKPIPTVTADMMVIPAEGGIVNVSVSSTLSEKIYLLNDTTCLDEPWSTNSIDSIEGGAGEFSLTVNANETGVERDLWVFVGHLNAQVAVLRLKQKGA